MARQDGHRQGRDRGGAHGVGGDHQVLAVPTVGRDAREQPEQPERRQPREATSPAFAGECDEREHEQRVGDRRRLRAGGREELPGLQQDEVAVAPQGQDMGRFSARRSGRSAERSAVRVSPRVTAKRIDVVPAWTALKRTQTVYRVSPSLRLGDDRGVERPRDPPDEPGIGELRAARPMTVACGFATTCFVGPGGSGPTGAIADAGGQRDALQAPE